MIEICPALLTDDLEVFNERLQQYVQAGFKSIDIDIADGEFVPHKTLPLEHVLMRAADHAGINFGWHLMVAQSQSQVEQIIQFQQDHNLAGRIYVHQESETAFLRDIDLFKNNVGIAIKVETNLREVGFYANYPEVQLMTVIAGAQGSGFESQAIMKSEDLRAAGYVGKISIDGGVNLQTARHIRDYDLNRVSVGSYFQNSQNLDLDWQKLNLALNL